MVNARKSDRRIIRTRRALKDALLNLIFEKGYEAVTVEEITRRADLGRTTFYLHYRDKDELLLEMLDAMIEDLVVQIEKVPLSEWGLVDGVPGPENRASQDPILLIFQHAIDNEDLYRIILRGEGAQQTGYKLRAIISSQVSKFVTTRMAEGKLSVKPRVPLDVFSHYFAGALMGFLTWWLESRQEYSPQAMADMFQTLFFMGAIEALGVSLSAPDENLS